MRGRRSGYELVTDERFVDADRAHQELMQAFESLGTPDAVEVLIGIAEREPQMREWGYRALGKSQSDIARDYLARKIESAEGAEEKFELARALNEAGDRRAVETMAEWAKANAPSKKEQQLHREVALFLGEEADPAGFDHLFAIFESGLTSRSDVDQMFSHWTLLPKKITGEDYKYEDRREAAGRAWRDWWVANRDTFVIPDRAARLRAGSKVYKDPLFDRD